MSCSLTLCFIVLLTQPVTWPGVGLAASKPLWFPCSLPSQRQANRHERPWLTFYVGVADLNLGPHDYLAKTLIHWTISLVAPCGALKIFWYIFASINNALYCFSDVFKCSPNLEVAFFHTASRFWHFSLYDDDGILNKWSCYVVLADLELARKPRLALNSWSSCLRLPGDIIISTCNFTWAWHLFILIVVAHFFSLSVIYY